MYIRLVLVKRAMRVIASVIHNHKHVRQKRLVSCFQERKKKITPQKTQTHTSCACYANNPKINPKLWVLDKISLSYIEEKSGGRKDLKGSGYVACLKFFDAYCCW